jgi:TonB family protein
MFCPQCGGEAGQLQPFCKFCGAKLTWTKAESPPKRKRYSFLQRAGLVLVIVFGLLLWHISISDKNTPPSAPTVEGPRPSSDAGQSIQSTPTESSQSPLTENPIPTYKIDDSFSVGYWFYTCHGAVWRTWLGSPYHTENPNGEFVLIDITARNDDTSSSTLPPFRLQDKEGRTYDESSAGVFEPGFFSVLQQLNPGVAKRGYLVFDVPPDREYVLVVSGGIESGKRAIVILPMSVPRSAPQSPPSPSYVPPPPVEPSSPPAQLPVHDEKPLLAPRPAPDIVKGSVSVSANPYPSIQIPPDLKGQMSRGGAKLEMAQLVSRVEPVYPQDAQQQRIEGTVKLHAIIGRDGSIHAIDHVSGPPLLVPAAATAVRQWRYRPTSLDGRPLEAGIDITMVFRLSVVHPN